MTGSPKVWKVYARSRCLASCRLIVRNRSLSTSSGVRDDTGDGRRSGAVIDQAF